MYQVHMMNFQSNITLKSNYSILPLNTQHSAYLPENNTYLFNEGEGTKGS